MTAEQLIALSKTDPILAAQITQEPMTVQMPLGLASTIIGALGIAQEHPRRPEDVETYKSLVKVLDTIWETSAASAHQRLTAPPPTDTAMLTFDPSQLN